MNDPLVSVVIPVFNSEDYLDFCIQSARTQTYQNLEILPVNDCSTDRSKAILEDHASKDQRVTPIHLPENQGILAARTAGIRKATGEYIVFMDSDDWMDSPMVETLVHHALETQSDISICGARIADTKNRPCGIKAQFSERILRGADGFHAFCRQDLGTAAMWNKIYKLDWMRDCFMADFGWRPNAAEDTLVNIGCFAKSRITATLPQTLYNYRIHSRNTTSTASNALGFARILRAYASAIDFYRDFTEEQLSMIDAYYRSSLQHPVYYVSDPKELSPHSTMLEDSIEILCKFRPRSLYEFANLGLLYPMAKENILQPGKSTLRFAKRTAQRAARSIKNALSQYK